MQAAHINELMYGARDRRAADSPLTFDLRDAPLKPFGERQWCTVPANNFPRPDGEHGYHFWSDQWVVPMDNPYAQKWAKGELTP